MAKKKKKKKVIVTLLKLKTKIEDYTELELVMLPEFIFADADHNIYFWLERWDEWTEEAQQAKALKVNEIEIDVGDWSGVDQEALQFSLNAVLQSEDMLRKRKLP